MSLSHWAVFPYILPAWRILAHYTAAITGFGLLPAPVATQISPVSSPPFNVSTALNGVPGDRRRRRTRPPLTACITTGATAAAATSPSPTRTPWWPPRTRAATRPGRPPGRSPPGSGRSSATAQPVSHVQHVRGGPVAVLDRRLPPVHRLLVRRRGGGGIPRDHRRGRGGGHQRVRLRGVPADCGDAAGGHGGAADRAADAGRAGHVAAAVHRPVPAAGAGAGEQRRRAAGRHGDPGDPGVRPGFPGRGQRGQPVLLHEVPSGVPVLQPGVGDHPGRAPDSRGVGDGDPVRPGDPVGRRRPAADLERRSPLQPFSPSGAQLPLFTPTDATGVATVAGQLRGPAVAGDELAAGPDGDAGAGELPLHQLRAARRPGRRTSGSTPRRTRPPGT